ncbi:MAG: hypothetical protein WBL20_14610, partial [Sphingobium sp.]
ALGLTLSIALPGCASNPPERPALIAIPLDSTPPPELMACPVPPPAFPTDSSAVIPPEIRAPMIALGEAYADAAARLRRLIRWHRPDAPC